MRVNPERKRETVVVGPNFLNSWFIYDFQICAEYEELKATLDYINRHGYDLISVTQDQRGFYTVFFQAPSLRLIHWRCCGVSQIYCRVCGCTTAPAEDHRCRLCREAKAATDSGTSYGRLKAVMYDLLGDVPDLPPETLRTCPICNRLFLPKRQNQVYDNRLCAQRAASKNYYKRKRKDAGQKGSGRSKENDYGPNPSD